MPSPEPSRRLLTRRDVMRSSGAAAAALLVGCTRDREPAPAPSESAAPAPDIAVLTAALEAERGLVAAFHGPIRVGPSAVRLVRSLRAHHAEHLAELEAAIVALGGVPPTAGETASPAVTGGSSLQTTASASPVPQPSRPSATGTTPALLRSQQRLHGRAAADGVGRASGGSTALLLAEIAASHAQHAVVLAGLR